MDALTYHEITKHSPESVRHGGRLDFSNRPRLFKKYVGLGSTPIPAALADLIHLSGGITKRLRGMPFRANACTGALYHIEIYLVSGDLDGLAAGVYHVDIEAEALVPLRSGDFRATVRIRGGLQRGTFRHAIGQGGQVYWAVGGAAAPTFCTHVLGRLVAPSPRAKRKYPSIWRGADIRPDTATPVTRARRTGSVRKSTYGSAVASKLNDWLDHRPRRSAVLQS
jgi:hypothetical protein